MAILSPVLALVLLGFLLLAGVALPLWSRSRAAGAAQASISERARLNVQLVDLVQGLPDLLAADLATSAVADLLATGDRLDRIDEQSARVRGLAGGVSALLVSLVAVVLLAIALPMVASGALPGVLLATVPLAAMAAFEAVQPLASGALAVDQARD